MGAHEKVVGTLAAGGGWAYSGGWDSNLQVSRETERERKGQSGGAPHSLTVCGGMRGGG